MAGEAYFMLGGWKAAADAFKADLKAAADSVLTDDSSPLAGAFLGKPRAYGGKYPAWSLFRLTSRGQCQHASRFMPGEMVAQVLVLAPATAPPGAVERSGRSWAEEITFEGFSAWIDRYWDLTVANPRAQEIEVSTTAVGSEDEFGRTMFQDNRSSALWAHSAEIVATL